MDSGVLADIVGALGPPSFPVVEIGPGTGQLTEALLEAGHEVIALEIEQRMLEHLRRRLQGHPRLVLVRGDARETDLHSLVPEEGEYLVAGNLPYFAASYITRRALEALTPPRLMVVMVQREVAREFAARAKLSLLAIGIQVFAEPELLFDVPPEAFDPPPAVWSSVVRLSTRPEPLVPRPELALFFNEVSRIFRSPRKQIHNGLGMEREAAAAVLAAAGIDPIRRPETLAISEWLDLVRAIEAGRHDR